MSNPANIRDSIAAAQAAAVAALDQLDPRLLHPGSIESAEQRSASAPDASEDEIRNRIEQMLYALLGDGSGHGSGREP